MSPPAPCTVHTPSPTALWLPAIAGAPISAQLQPVGQTPTPPSVVVLPVLAPSGIEAETGGRRAIWVCDPNQLAGSVVHVLGRGVHGVGRGAVAREALIVGLPPERVREVGVLVAERIYHRRLLVAARVARDDIAGRRVAHRRDVRGRVGDSEHAVDHVARLA